MEATVADQECTPRMQLSGLPSRDRGDLLLRQYACHACHRIEGVVGPHTHVGPEIIDWRSRKYIAGVIPNTFENLTRWIIEPDAMKPGTLMPDMDVPPAHAREMARFLLSTE
jgi:cytochrome c2